MKNLFFFVAVAALLASCSKEDLSQTTSSNGNTPLGVTSASLSAMVSTKSASGVTTNGSKIGVYQLASTGYTASTNFAEYDYSTGTSAWSGVSNPIYLNNNPSTVVGYYPWGAAGITTGSVPSAVTLTSQKYDPAQDLSYQSVTGLSNQNASVSFVMNHAYSRLTFVISRDATYTGTGDVRRISITNTATNILTSNTLDMTPTTGGGVYGTGTAGTVIIGDGTTALVNVPLPTATPNNVSQSLLMVPVTTDMTGSTITITFNVDGTTLTATLAGSSLKKLPAGNVYAVGVVVQGTQLVVSGVSVTDWATDSGYTQPTLYPHL